MPVKVGPSLVGGDTEALGKQYEYHGDELGGLHGDAGGPTESGMEMLVEGLGDPPKFDREIRGRMTVVVRRNVTAAPAGN